jgi:protein O-GlcNAc transferase
VAASLLHAVGLPELVTRNLAEYETLALRLATEPSLIRGFRDRLDRNRLSFPLFDSDRFCRHMEAAFKTMWDLWHHAEPPQSFAVDPIPAAAPAAIR